MWSVLLFLLPFFGVNLGEAQVPESSQAASSGQSVGQLHAVHWTVSVWGRKLAGTGCWLSGPDDMLRLEVKRGGAEKANLELVLPDLLNRSGEGWTFSVIDDTTVVYQPWGEHWRAYDASLARALTVLTGVCEGSESMDDMSGVDGVRSLTVRPRSIPRPRWLTNRQQLDAGGQQLRIEVDDHGTEASFAAAGPAVVTSPTKFRQENCQRGFGRGGVGEVWSVWRTPAGESTGWLHRITSSRRPGNLEVTVPRSWQVMFPYPETFLPVWSLTELLQW